MKRLLLLVLLFFSLLGTLFCQEYVITEDQLTKIKETENELKRINLDLQSLLTNQKALRLKEKQQTKSLKILVSELKEIQKEDQAYIKKLENKNWIERIFDFIVGAGMGVLICRIVTVITGAY